MERATGIEPSPKAGKLKNPNETLERGQSAAQATFLDMGRLGPVCNGNECAKIQARERKGQTSEGFYFQ